MVYHPILYRLLGIPENDAEPTVYQLLGIEPGAHSAEAVDRALNERKKRLRQSIPGPQFIPMIALFEKELDKAAALLLDSRKRTAYDRKLAAEAQDEKARQKSERRQKLIHSVRRVMRRAMNPDGTLDEARRPAVAAELRKLGLRKANIAKLLADIPLPATLVPTQAAGPTPEVLEYFAATVDKWIAAGPIGPAEEQQLVSLAEKLGIPRDAALAAIDQRQQAGAAAVKDQFRKQVLALHPDGACTNVERARLIDMARAQGIAQGLAAEVIDATLTLRSAPGAPPQTGSGGGQVLDAILLDSTPGAPAGMGDQPIFLDEPEPLRLHADALQPQIVSPQAGPGTQDGQPGEVAPAPKRGTSTLTKILLTALPIAAVLIFTVLAILHSPQWFRRRDTSRPALRPATAITVPATATTAPVRPAPQPDAQAARLRDRLLAAPSEPDLAARLAPPGPHLRAAVRSAAELLWGAATPSERLAAERFFNRILCMRVDPAVQHIVVSELVRATREAPTSSAARRPAALLASALFLSPSASPPQPAAFADRCETAWAESRRRHPSDPLHDPRRLADAAMQGGMVEAYARSAGANRFDAVADQLAERAAKGSTTDAMRAVGVLSRLATDRRSTAGDAARKLAQLALCDVVEHTSDRQIGSAARALLAAALRAHAGDPVRSMSIDTPAQRAAVAARLRGIADGTITSGPPAPTTPRPTPRVPTPTPSSVATADVVRKAYCTGGGKDDTLADLALVMLVCAERAERFAAGSSPLSQQLTTVVNMTASNRAAELTRQTSSRSPYSRLPRTPVTPAPAAPAPKNTKSKGRRLAELKKQVGSMYKSERYHAIEELRKLDTHEAAAILLGALKSRLRSSTRASCMTVSRLLRALRRMNDPKIAPELVPMLARAAKFQAHQIVKTLSEESGYTYSTLKPDHSTDELRQALEYWQQRTSSGFRWNGQYHYPGRPTRPTPTPSPFRRPTTPATATQQPPAWEPDATKLKLLALVHYYTTRAADALEACKAGGAPASAPRTALAPSSVLVPGDLAGELAGALGKLAAQLGRLARDHARGKKNARRIGVGADAVELQMRGRVLASDTPLQQAAARLDAARAMLELLVQSHDANAAGATALATIRKEHAAAVANALTVAEELREHAHASLRLWDLLAKVKRGRIP